MPRGGGGCKRYGTRRVPLTGRLAARAMHLAWRFSRPLTGGARGMVLEGGGEGEGRERRVLLVRHTYLDGWHLPGGGVEAGETFEDALARELREEAAVALTTRPRLHGLYHNPTGATRRDHVALYVVTAFTRGDFEPNAEIAEAAMHPVEGLPDSTTDAVRARLREVLEGLPPSPTW